MTPRLKNALLIGIGLLAAALFVWQVYLPFSREKRTEFKVQEAIRPSGQFKDRPVKEVPEFSFIAHGGDTVDKSTMAGKVWVADFFYTSCDAACPMMSSSLTRVQENLSGHEDFRILSHTLDPERDSMYVLRRYARRYGAMPGVWFLVRGERDSIFRLAEEGYLQTVVDEENMSIVNHSMRLILVDRNSQIRGFYNGTDSLEVDMLINDAGYLLYRKTTDY